VQHEPRLGRARRQPARRAGEDAAALPGVCAHVTGRGEPQAAAGHEREHAKRREPCVRGELYKVAIEM
jgi:hypothetical protein